MFSEATQYTIKEINNSNKSSFLLKNFKGTKHLEKCQFFSKNAILYL